MIKATEGLVLLKLFTVQEQLEEMRKAQKGEGNKLVDKDDEPIEKNQAPALLGPDGKPIEENIGLKLDAVDPTEGIEFYDIAPETKKDLGIPEEATKVYLHPNVDFGMNSMQSFCFGQIEVDGEMWCIGAVRPAFIIGYE